MYPDLLWNGIAFSAEGGRTAALLQYAAQHGLQLRDIRATAGGFSALCGAGRYRKLSRMARHYRVHLHIYKRFGLYFQINKTIQRIGLWAGVAVFGVLLGISQKYIWSISYSDLSVGGQARAAAILRDCGLAEGAFVQPQMLTLGETALIETGNEFGWASLNFAGGRLTVETAPAKPVPTIELNRATDIHAKAAAMIAEVHPEKGTPAVQVGQTVAAGQVLIAVNRTDRKGNAVPGYAAGTVLGDFYWDFETAQPLCQTAEIPKGSIESSWDVLCFGRRFRIGEPDEDVNHVHRRHGALSLFGLALPVSYCETEYLPCAAQKMEIGTSLALARARLAAVRALKKEWPDAKVITQEEQYEIEERRLQYAVRMLIRADICE